MSQKVYLLISSVTVGVMAIAEALIVFFEPPYQTAICACIPVVEGAIITCCSNFKDAKTKTLKRI